MSNENYEEFDIFQRRSFYKDSKIQSMGEEDIFCDIKMEKRFRKLSCADEKDFKGTMKSFIIPPRFPEPLELPPPISEVAQDGSINEPEENLDIELDEEIAKFEEELRELKIIKHRVSNSDLCPQDAFSGKKVKSDQDQSKLFKRDAAKSHGRLPDPVPFQLGIFDKIKAEHSSQIHLEGEELDPVTLEGF
ncbi:unnamed protein product [Moneuplotes crassus]|uniref:Uncharacterized protein n=1 Tax=Euplotes crassus TaxID=5936 RepID=A0AAD1XBD3_EUPCR|nr:unnamed protein product [Moneuplotes crassus]